MTDLPIETPEGLTIPDLWERYTRLRGAILIQGDRVGMLADEVAMLRRLVERLLSQGYGPARPCSFCIEPCAYCAPTTPDAPAD